MALEGLEAAVAAVTRAKEDTEVDALNNALQHLSDHASAARSAARALRLIRQEIRQGEAELKRKLAEAERKLHDLLIYEVQLCLPIATPRSRFIATLESALEMPLGTLEQKRTPKEDRDIDITYLHQRLMHSYSRAITERFQKLFPEHPVGFVSNAKRSHPIPRPPKGPTLASEAEATPGLFVGPPPGLSMGPPPGVLRLDLDLDTMD